MLRPESHRARKTYPLPGAARPVHAQGARGLSLETKKEVLLRMSSATRSRSNAYWIRLRSSPRESIAALYVDQKVVDYIVDLVRATRDPSSVGLAALKPLVAFGASPRASIALAQAARAHAFLRGRAYVVPEDVRALALEVLRHRVVLTFEAEAEELDSDAVITRILDALPVPNSTEYPVRVA